MSTIIIPFIHVAILFAFIFKKAKPGVVASIKERSVTISDKINESKRVVAEMQKRRAEIEERANKIPELKNKILNDWKAREEEQIQKIKEGSLKIQEQLKLDAARNMKALQANLSRDVRISVSNKLVALAEQKVLAGLNPSAKTAIESKFLSEVVGAQ